MTPGWPQAAICPREVCIYLIAASACCISARGTFDCIFPPVPGRLRHNALASRKDAHAHRAFIPRRTPPMHILWTYLRPHSKLAWLALLLAAISQVLALVDPIIFGKIIDGYAINPGDQTDAELLSGVLRPL